MEGFVRQILGWREFIRGIYWLHMPGYATKNALNAERALPWFYWSGETRMNCLRQAVQDTRAHAYAHHIQRLMITGNFALLAGIDPDEVDEWYIIVTRMRIKWVEMPNTRGMALFADGGIVGSKPYAAGGAYINRMSDYCKGCAYDVTMRWASRPARSTIFTGIFWRATAGRWAAISGWPCRCGRWRGMDAAKVDAMRANAARFLRGMEAGEEV